MVEVSPDAVVHSQLTATSVPTQTYQVMGILNVTPDSFYDGGYFRDMESAFAQAVCMHQDGANIIDVGGESTRPNASPVGLQEELDRVIPVIEKIASELDVCISVDTSRPEVMIAAVKAGARFINDVRALSLPGAFEAVLALNVPVCLMHMQGTPQTMQVNPTYKDVVSEIFHFLEEKICYCIEYGIKKEHIIIDPGFGFGKTTQQQLQLLRDLSQFKKLECPILVGLSRKNGVFKEILKVPETQRLHASVAGAVMAYLNGANILRVHDVAATCQALKYARAVYHEVY